MKGMSAQVVEAQPSNASATATVKRLTPVVAERRQKLQDEMLGAYSVFMAEIWH